MNQPDKIAEKLQKLMRDVGDFIRRESQVFEIESSKTKGVNDFVSYVDLESEKMLVSGLREILPEAGFITEEETTLSVREDLMWVIDPLDGTTNFIHGLPPYSISVALTEGEKIIVGAVYVVTSNEMFCATLGGGSWLNGKRIKVSRTDKISGMLVGTGFPFKDYSYLEAYLKTFQYFIRNTQGVRRMGSAAVDLAYVACGRFDGFFEYNLNPWDVTAGILLIREAGGLVSDFSGNKSNLSGLEIVASNNTIYKDFLTIVSSNMKMATTR